jgi:quaternary ammonium compound-resistance protein SugE
MGIQQPDAGYDRRIDGGEVGKGNILVAWYLLVLAGLCEIVWAVGLKYTDGFSKPVASAVTLAFMGASVWLLAEAIKTIPVGTGYAIWTGIGAVGTAIAGMILFGESRAAIRLGCIAMIVAGIVGLKIFSDATTT